MLREKRVFLSCYEVKKRDICYVGKADTRDVDVMMRGFEDCSSAAFGFPRLRGCVSTLRKAVF